MSVTSATKIGKIVERCMQEKDNCQKMHVLGLDILYAVNLIDMVTCYTCHTAHTHSSNLSHTSFAPLTNVSL